MHLLSNMAIFGYLCSTSGVGGKSIFTYQMTPQKKKTTNITFHCTGSIGILKMVYHPPHITGIYNLLYTLNSQLYALNGSYISYLPSSI